MATVDKNFKIKNGLIVGDSTNLVNYTSASPSNPFIGQLWINDPFLYAWSGSAWSLVGDGGATASLPAGGTIGQILAKIDATNYNTEWIDNYTSNVKHEVKAAEALIKGNAVYVSSATGTNMLVSKASNTSDQTSARTMGLIDSTLNTNDIGFVITEGLLSGLNTSTASVGDPVWLGVGGNLLYGFANKPHAPAHLVYIGVITRVHAVNGEIFINVANGYEIEELHDVLIQSASNNNILYYNSASSLWMNKDLQAAIKEVDGSGSGIDADLLDGQDSTYFMQASASSNFLPTSASSNYLRIDNASAIYLNKTDAENIYLPSASYNASDILNKIKTVDGSGSGLDADLLDGNDSSYYLSTETASLIYLPSASYTASDVLNKIKTVDGQGSGLDADLLDGQNSLYFLNTSSATQEKVGDITFHGTLTVNELVVSGSSTFIATQDLSVTDSLILLASEQYNSDGLDIGFIGSYGDGTTSSASHYHASFARDASQNKWKLLSNGPAPVNNVIDYSSPLVEYGVLQLKSIEVSSSVVTNNFNADLLDGNHGSYYMPQAASATFQPLDGDLTAIAANTGNGLLKRTATDTWITITDNSTNWDTAYTDRLKWDGGSTGLTAATGRTSLGATTVGSNIFTLTNPSAITFLKVNADNTVSTESAATYKTSLSLNNVENTALSTWAGSTNITTVGTLAIPTIKSPKEPITVSATAATGSVQFDISTQAIVYYTSNATANWTLNVRGNSTTSLNSIMNNGESLSLVFMVTNGTTAYYHANMMIDGLSVTPKWQGGSAPTGGNASSIDIYTFDIIKTASATYTILAALTGFA